MSLLYLSDPISPASMHHPRSSLMRKNWEDRRSGSTLANTLDKHRSSLPSMHNIGPAEPNRAPAACRASAGDGSIYAVAWRGPSHGPRMPSFGSSAQPRDAHDWTSSPSAINMLLTHPYRHKVDLRQHNDPCLSGLLAIGRRP